MIELRAPHLARVRGPLPKAEGSYISKNNASFDSRNYGYSKLGELVRAQQYVEINETGDPGGITHLHVRIR